MNREAGAALEGVRGLRAVVLGDPMLDVYLTGTASRVSPEAPVPVVDIAERLACPGGAANVASNVAALGAQVRLVGVTGDDAQAMELRACLREAGVDTRGLVSDRGRTTLEKVRVVAAGRSIARLDRGTNAAPDAGVAERVASQLSKALARADLVLVSDYGYHTVEGPTMRVLDQARARGLAITVDAKDLARYRHLSVLLAKPNYAQAMSMLPGAQPASGDDRAAAIARHAPHLLEATGAQLVAVTMDAGGALVLAGDGSMHRTYAAPANGSAAGAGDTFLATLSLALVAGCPPASAADLATTAASLVVGKHHTATCPVAELRARFLPGSKLVRDRAVLADRVAEARREGRTIVFTNGCFDIVHSGHVRHLEQARARGDFLVVGVNSDASVRRLKGPTRPLVGLDDRLNVLAALHSVDLVVPFEEDTPEALIRAVRPDVFVKGGDYDRVRLPEAPLVEALGGRVEILPHLDGLSTTGLIRRVHSERTAKPPPGRERAS